MLRRMAIIAAVALATIVALAPSRSLVPGMVKRAQAATH